MNYCYCKGLLFQYGICLLLFLPLLSCSVGADYASPYLQKSTNYSISEGSGIAYRALAIEDFHAPELANKDQDGRHDIHAQSCIRMHVSKDSAMEITPVAIEGLPRYSGRMLGASFEALFQPSCSWWNPAVPEEKKDYVLQHEQVHFALSELSARRLSQHVAAEMQGVVVTGKTYEDVQAGLNAKFERVASTVLQDELKHHIQFDEETSLLFDRSAQEAWLDRVELQLQEGGDL